MSKPAEALTTPNLHESLVFRHRWWWDPVPDWIMPHLDRAVIREVAVTQINLQRTVLEAQLKATDQVLGILSKSR
jgi:hypothetical protein